MGCISWDPDFPAPRMRSARSRNRGSLPPPPPLCHDLGLLRLAIPHAAGEGRHGKTCPEIEANPPGRTSFDSNDAPPFAGGGKGKQEKVCAHAAACGARDDTAILQPSEPTCVCVRERICFLCVCVCVGVEAKVTKEMRHEP
jgi:hypothetical protein